MEVNKTKTTHSAFRQISDIQKRKRQTLIHYCCQEIPTSGAETILMESRTCLKVNISDAFVTLKGNIILDFCHENNHVHIFVQCSKIPNSKF